MEPHHIAYLTSPLTLQKWACRSLVERAVLFHRRFGEVKISAWTLSRVYRKAGIKRKAIRFSKRMSYNAPEKRQQEIDAMLQKVRGSLESGRRMIFSDEAVFTTATLPVLGYA